MGLFKKNKKHDDILKMFDGRIVKYITRREVSGTGSVNHNVVGKGGRIVLIGEEIRIICGEKDIYCGNCQGTECCMLLSGDGATVTGENKLTGTRESYTVYFSYFRK